VLTQITQLAKDSSFNGTNLISNGDPSNKLHIAFNEKGQGTLDIGVEQEVALPVRRRTRVAGDRGQAQAVGSNLSVVQNRQSFSKNLINVLDTGAANLTNADLNLEAANSQALSTRQSFEKL
jgi:flagellin